MATYSHSKISTYEQCPYKYKLHYIDRIKPEVTQTIETFMGDLVHQTLEKLYKDKKNMKRISKATILKFYKDLWEKEYSEDILVAKEEMSAENYRKMGLKYLEDYYDTYKPFEDLTILGLETQDMMTLPDGNKWYVRIDKFACDNEGNYYVCDYKTNSRMKDQEEADEDRQLAMYSFWVKDKFRDAKKVILKWHMLAFNKEVTSERTEEQLRKLQEEVMSIIKEIETAKDFPRNETALCNYCTYHDLCPSFKHEAELEKKELEEFKKDQGVILVDSLAEIKKELKELTEKEEELKEKLVAYAKQFGVDVVYGSNMKSSVKEYDKIVLPEDKDELIKLLKTKGFWDDLVTLNFMKFQSQILKNEIKDEEIVDKIVFDRDFRITLSKRKDVDED